MNEYYLDKYNFACKSFILVFQSSKIKKLTPWMTNEIKFEYKAVGPYKKTAVPSNYVDIQKSLTTASSISILSRCILSTTLDTDEQIDKINE
ncbi:hypothetical protein BpHYR1_007330 [Brachionus plicatilis]|uniref:Uncharacterized protein n=1 Tax=Brachionus plicatilis TaxID=10195 RepID=A0A3M7RZC4_BRAPC|nr:hypothetical protein BpHYR1_007330 [Brachionus plicatilis]